MTWIDLLWAIPAYGVVGLFSARYTRFGMENHLDRLNADKALPYAQWRKEHQGHAESRWGNHCYTCDTPSPSQPRTMSSYYGSDAQYGWPVAFGVFWPVLPTLYGTFRVGLVVARSIRPGAEWFFENPRHRKQRRNNSQ